MNAENMEQMEQRRLAGHEGIVKSTRSTLLVMVCTISSRILGFLRVAVIGAVFGADGKADVLNAVFTIPNNLRKLLAEGALSSAFIPVLSETIENEEHPKRSVEITRSILAFQWLVLVPIVLLSIVFAGPTTGVLIDFPEPERMQLSVDVFRWFIIYLFLISTSAVLMGVLHAHDIFFVPALTPILFSVSVIISIFMFHDELGVFSMVIGVLVGGVAQILFQFPRYKKKGYSLFPRFNFKDPAFRRIIRQWLPVVATASVFTINQQVAVRFATGLENGSASALSNALVFWQLPFGIFSASITTVLFPKMSREFTRNDYKNLRATVTYGLRFLFVLLIPSSIVLMFQGAGIISVTLQRGAFTAANTSMAADVLLYYSFGLFSVGAFTFLQRFFYAIGNYRVPLYTAALVCAVDIALSLWLKETFLRVRGLALANSLSFTLGLIILLFHSSKLIGGFEWKEMLKSFWKTLVPLPIIIIYSIWYANRFPMWWVAGSKPENLLRLALVLVPITTAIFLIYLALKVDMLRNAIHRGTIKNE